MNSLVIAALLAATAAVKPNVAASVPEPPDGGMVTVGAEGRIVLVNACDAPTEPLTMAAKKLGNLLMITADVEKGPAWSLAGAAEAYRAARANVAVFVIRDPALPLSLIALEARWGVVNALELDVKRLEKETLRVATVLLGGASSKYPASTMRPVFSAKDLDAAGELMTFDSLMAIFPHLEALGIRQFQTMTYRDACEQDIFLKPVNDEQRAILKEYKK